MDKPQQEAARYAQAAERETQLKHLQERKAVDSVFSTSPIKFKVSNNEVIRMLGGVVSFDADRNPVVNGVPLQSAIENVARIVPHAVATAVGEIHDKGASSVRSLEDLPTLQDRVAYVAAHGDLAFGRLPRTSNETQPVPTDELTWAQYKSLSPRERSRIAGEKGPEFIAQLQHKAGEQQRFDCLVGVPTGPRRG